jgi:hypothetical protein
VFFRLTDHVGGKIFPVNSRFNGNFDGGERVGSASGGRRCRGGDGNVI